jgi:RNA polymerase-binding transcription factor DksA
MVLRVKRTNDGLLPGPVGAPRVTFVRHLLLTLKERLETQLTDDSSLDTVAEQAMRGNIQRQIAQIDTALAHIEEGNYGICATCLKPIDADRLVVRPFSTLCTSCQSRVDRGNRSRH